MAHFLPAELGIEWSAIRGGSDISRQWAHPGRRFVFGVTTRAKRTIVAEHSWFGRLLDDMARDFDELDHCHTPMGELSFAPRKDPSFGVDVFEDKLAFYNPLQNRGSNDIHRARRRGCPISEMQMTEIAPEFINRLRKRLELELEELDALLQQTAHDSAPVQLDQQSVGRVARMDAMQMQAMAQETQRRRRERRPRIEAALQRIQRGEFGYCARCGEAISEKRLEIDPTYLVCIDCAR